MRPLSNVTTDTLYWVKPQTTPEHLELFDGDEVIGIVNRASARNHRVIAKIAGNQWTIEHTVFQHWAVRDAESEPDIAIYESSFWRSFWSNSGKLTLWAAQMHHTSRPWPAPAYSTIDQAYQRHQYCDIGAEYQRYRSGK